MRFNLLAIIGLCFTLLGPAVCLAVPPGPPSPGQPPTVNAAAVADAGQILAQLKRQEETFATELRQLKRELALLRLQREKPGLREIIAGLGYILGLLGVASYVAGKKHRLR